MMFGGAEKPKTDMDRRASDFLAGYFQRAYRENEGEEVEVGRQELEQAFVEYVTSNVRDPQEVIEAHDSIRRIWGLVALRFGHRPGEEN